MRKSLLPVLVLASVAAGCSQQSVYPLFPAEATGPGSAYTKSGFIEEQGLGRTRNYDAALANYREAARQGDAAAMNNLGVMALHGRGTRSNAAAAKRHFQKAADAGSAVAHYNLGLMYDLGIGGRQSFEDAARHYKISSEMGYWSAQQRLAQLYELGQGVERSEEKARHFYTLAAASGNGASLQRLALLKRQDRYTIPMSQTLDLFAEENCACDTSSERAMASRGRSHLAALAGQGDAPAQYNIAVRLLNGEGSHQDPSEAARYFTLSARQGYAPAQRQLANLHLRGQSVAKSKVLAHAWLNLAAQGSGDDAFMARRQMEELEVTMSVAEVRHAQELARSGDLLR